MRSAVRHSCELVLLLLLFDLGGYTPLQQSVAMKLRKSSSVARVIATLTLSYNAVVR